jgi:hypothetical protein
MRQHPFVIFGGGREDTNKCIDIFSPVLGPDCKFIQTDSAQFYPRAFKKLFYSNKIGGLVVEHKIQNVRRTKIHNYKIETVFMKIKDRVHDFRGLKSLWSAPIIMVGLTIQHNFIEKHCSTNSVPCELAGQDLNLGENRWLGLIKLASA